MIIETLINEDKTAKRWKESFEELYKSSEFVNEREYISTQNEVNKGDVGQSTIKRQFEIVLKEHRLKKEAAPMRYRL